MTRELIFLEPIHDDQMKKGRRNSLMGSPTSSPASFSFIKKFWRDKKHSTRKSGVLSIIDGNEISSSVEENLTPSPSPVLFRRALGRRLSVSSTDNDENLLHYAVTNQDIQTLNRLLKDNSEKIDINFMRPPGVSALHQACVFGNTKIVKLLVEKGADIHLKTWRKLSPLKIAVLFGNYEAAKFLVNCGADSDEIKDGFQCETRSEFI